MPKYWISLVNENKIRSLTLRFVKLHAVG